MKFIGLVLSTDQFVFNLIGVRATADLLSCRSQLSTALSTDSVSNSCALYFFGGINGGVGRVA